MSLPMGQNLVKSGSTWARLCRTHISETGGWIYAIQSSVELTGPVVVQHHGHLTLTLDFQGQIVKMLYLRNGRADWHGMKGMWVDRMLDPHCDFELWPHPWPWPLIFLRSNFETVSGMGYLIDIEQKGCESIGYQSFWMDFMLRLPNCTDRHQMLIILTNSTSDI